MGGWNKGIKNSTGTAFKGKKHKQESIEKLKNRPKECYKKPQAESIDTIDKCDYGCNEVAKYKFSNGKLCCSSSHNSCPAKRKAFSNLDHSQRTSKSLQTRLEKGITKSSRKKAHQTMLDNGTYEITRKRMQEYWKNRPWQNNIECPLVTYKNTEIKYQGTYEYDFLETLEKQHGILWLTENVKRGPAIWYHDPSDNVERLYISDFIIYNTVYEIKSSWTWNKHGKDIVLEEKNKAKLNAAKKEGYHVILVLDKEYINA